jgi:hypothetical protein
MRVFFQPCADCLKEGKDLGFLWCDDAFTLELLDMEAKKVKTLCDMHDTGFVRVQFQSAFLQPVYEDRKQCFDVFTRFCRHHEVICVADQAVDALISLFGADLSFDPRYTCFRGSVALKGLLKTIKRDICE